MNNKNMTDKNELIEYIGDEYKILNSLGSGSFGIVYRVECLKGKHKGQMMAAKIEQSNKKSRVKIEYKLYNKLNPHNGIPKVYDYMTNKNSNILIMELLGLSLEDMFNKCNRKFKLSTVFELAIQIISLIQYLHNKKIIHRDIKPNNFLLGSNNTQIYIMDFGLSKLYVDKYNHHIPFKDKRSLVGTARYASTNIHFGIEPSRRDDIESIGYILIYFLKGVLPWQGIKKKKNVTHDKHIEMIGEHKICTSIDYLCKGLPQCFKDYLEYCHDMLFEDEPDYEYLKGLFIRDAKMLNIIPKFEWI